MKELKVKDLELIGKGMTASVYIIDEKSVIKIFRDVVPMDEIQYEYDCAKRVENLGITTPKASEIVKTDGGVGIVYERITGDTLSEKMHEDVSKIYDYGVQYGEIVKDIHEKKITDNSIIRASDDFKSFFDNSEDFVSPDEKKELYEYIDMVPQRDSLLHGDIAPVNIMVQDGKLYVIDVPTIMVGHPIFDLLQPFTFCKVTTKLYEDYLSMTEEEKKSPVGIFLSRFGARYFKPEQSERVWEGFLKGYFGDIGLEKKDIIEYTLNFYNSIKFMGSTKMRAKFGDEVVRFMTDYGRTWLQKNKDNNDIQSYVMDKSIF
ncbi:MAG: phosphotransferase [Lachnospiraceae bacterium]|nr:phosphotransferase [Lachnospiraceae bacterium]